MEKQVLRKLIYEKTGELSDEYIAEANGKITGLVTESEAFLKAKTLFVFISTGMEPDTEQIIKTAKKQGKRVCVPRCGMKPNMDAVEVTADTRFEPGYFGIPEPTGGAVCAPADIDLVIVPCVTASADGKRLGHGAGYYDTYLKTTKATRMCLCYKALLSENIPTDENDVRMDVVVTD